MSLHDIGKCANGFQHLVPEFADWLDTAPQQRAAPHTPVGLLLWDAHLAGRLVPLLTRRPSFDLTPLMEAVFGHHGTPLRSNDVSVVRAQADLLTTPSIRDAAVQLAKDLFWPDEPADTGSRTQNRLASWWLAGLVTVAGWVGSNQRWFTYQAPSRSLTNTLNTLTGRAGMNRWRIASALATARE